MIKYFGHHKDVVNNLQQLKFKKIQYKNKNQKIKENLQFIHLVFQ